MIAYHKINTLYKRDEKGRIIPNDYSQDEFAYLRDLKWECTEKIDGTNISIQLTPQEMTFHGRTDKAQIPPMLQEKLNQLFCREKLVELFGHESHIALFGEGYGAKIQKCGQRYIPEGVDFILFDVLIDGLWLERSSVEDIASKLNIRCVPLIGYMTITEAEKMVMDGFTSIISEDKNLPAEGLICKTSLGLLTRRGSRIITKIKSVDYEKLK